MTGWKGTLIIGLICALVGAFAYPLFQAIWRSTAELRISIEWSKFELPPPNPDYYGANGILFAELQNTGNKRASSVKIKIPNAESVRYELEGKQIVTTGSVISISELEPDEKILMTVWTRYEPSEYSLQDISLTHSEGMGQVIIEQKYMGNPLWIFLKQWGVFFLLMSLFLVNIFYNAYAEVQKSRKQT